MRTQIYQFVKRLSDIVAALLGIIITSPLWVIAIIGIEISDPGPIFYIANRVGKNNEGFKMFKFRSMRVDKKANEKSFKADTNRIFPFGAFMRASKIDELPQLLNLVKGDMSIVGPRPAAVDQLSVVRAGQYSVVSSIKPGLTGPAALYDYIYGDTIENEAEYEEKVLPTRLNLELYYTNNMNFLYDIILILQTCKCILCTVLKKQPNKLLAKLEIIGKETKESIPAPQGGVRV